MKHIITGTAAKIQKAEANIRSRFPKARLTAMKVGKKVALYTSNVLDSELAAFQAAS